MLKFLSAGILLDRDFRSSRQRLKALAINTEAKLMLTVLHFKRYSANESFITAAKYYSSRYTGGKPVSRNYKLYVAQCSVEFDECTMFLFSEVHVRERLELLNNSSPFAWYIHFSSLIFCCSCCVGLNITQ